MDSQAALKHVRTAEMLTSLKAQQYFVDELGSIYVRLRDEHYGVEHVELYLKSNELTGDMLSHALHISESEFEEARYMERWNNYCDRFEPKMTEREFRNKHSIELIDL